MQTIGKRFGLHALLLERPRHHYRPVIEDYQALYLHPAAPAGFSARAALLAEQVGLAAGGSILTFQEREHNLWDEVALRLEKGGNKTARRSRPHLTHARSFRPAGRLHPDARAAGREEIEGIEQTLLSDGGGETLTEICGSSARCSSCTARCGRCGEMLGRFVANEADAPDPAPSRRWNDIQQDVYQVLDAVETCAKCSLGNGRPVMTKAKLRMSAIWAST